MLKRLSALSLLAVFAFALAWVIRAQDLSVVYVTPQDNAVLRGGPGTSWDRLAVLPFGETYRATGRTIEADWIQIAYTGPLEAGARDVFTQDGVTYGWVAYWLLVWTGDILTLPIDGVGTVPTARVAGTTLILEPDEYIYEDEVDASRQVDNPFDQTVQVELTGRLGSENSGHFWLQFKMNGRFYWTGTWATGVPFGYERLPDRSYLFVYGRLGSQLRLENFRLNRMLADIGERWRALDRGQPTTCNNIPDDFRLRAYSFNPADLIREPIYGPSVTAIQNAVSHVNTAIRQFREICAQPGDRVIDSPTIQAGLDEIESAERHLNIVRLLIAPYERRDPFFTTDESANTEMMP
ncbi:MAG: hypothetical protein MUF87_09700 [Anaerolineae bacterium]|jgi:hypothetical protein|nr:hypothetical protein [Anaerolineae bacterium]